MRALVVDDLPENCLLLEALLTAEGWEVVTAANGRLALDQFQNQAFDLIISDILMPVMDGFHLCRELKADGRASAIPFVFYTATYTDQKDEELALSMGADRFVRKPTEPDEFMAIIRRTVEEAASGGASSVVAREPTDKGEVETLKLYNERLITKLEKKMLDLEKEVGRRKRAEKDLEQTNAVFSGIVRLATEAIIATDDSQSIKLFNEGAEAAFGYTAIEVLGRPLEMLMPERFAAVHGRHFASFLGDPTRSSMRMGEGKEVWCRRKDGSEFMAEGSIAKTVFSGQTTLSVVLRDITERTRAEQALRESESNYRGLVQNATYGIYRSTTSGKFLMVNRALVEMLGYGSATELLSVEIVDLYLDPEQRIDLVEEGRRTGNIDAPEVLWRRLDGTPITVHLTGRVVREDEGGAEYFEVIVENVTVRHDLELQLRQSQRMDGLGRLAGGIAHDFNNLLTVILGTAESGLETFAPGDSGHVMMSQIEAAGQRAAALTRQLLAFSRQQAVDIRACDMNALVTDMDRMLKRLVGEDIEMVTRTQPELGVVEADAGQIEQVLVNLVVNARDAMLNGGKLRVETLNVTLDDTYTASREGLKPGDYVALTVGDTGTGMTDEVQAKLFDPFFTTKGLGLGTGLGLATSYGIVKQHGGHISVSSELQIGTVVTVYLPRIDKELEISVPASAAPPMGSETLLVVEDDPGVRDIEVRILQRLGYTVLQAGSGEAAIEILEERDGDFDLIITDIVMPGIGGRGLAERARALDPERKMLFLSGYSDDILLQREIESNEVDFLRKPFTSRVLARKVREVLDRR